MREEKHYEKKVAALLFCSMMILAFSVTALAMPAYRCETTITSANHRAQGVTECGQATYCSVSLTARYSGGVKTDFRSGVSASSASVSISAPYEFITADSTHRIEYYENGYLNTYTTGTGAAAK